LTRVLYVLDHVYATDGWSSTFVGLLELRLRGQVRHGGSDLIYVGGVYDLGYVIERVWICIMYVVCSMYCDNATEKEENKGAEERGSRYIHFSVYIRRVPWWETVNEEGRYRERAAVRQEWKARRPTAGAGCPMDLIQNFIQNDHADTALTFLFKLQQYIL
jgi:hypothetical protein